MASTLFGVFVRSRGCSAWARLGGVVCLLPAEWQTHWNRREYRGSVGGNNTQEREMLYFLRIGRWHDVLEKHAALYSFRILMSALFVGREQCYRRR